MLVLFKTIAGEWNIGYKMVSCTFHMCGTCNIYFLRLRLHSNSLWHSNHEVVLPFRTSSYNDGKESDDNEAQIAMCTLRSFPYLPKHCIEFAQQAYFSD